MIWHLFISQVTFFSVAPGPTVGSGRKTELGSLPQGTGNGLQTPGCLGGWLCCIYNGVSSVDCDTVVGTERRVPFPVTHQSILSTPTHKSLPLTVTWSLLPRHLRKWGLSESGEGHLIEKGKSGLCHESWDTPEKTRVSSSTNSGLQVSFWRMSYTRIPSDNPLRIP